MNTDQNIKTSNESYSSQLLNKTFSGEILTGLRTDAKYLPSKYFYDNEGDQLFQEIMNCEEYYPFNCELEIFKGQTQALAHTVMEQGNGFDLIELGAGDCTKSKYLLEYLVAKGAEFAYMPIDISANIIDYLELQLPLEIPGLQVTGLKGEYFNMLEKATKNTKRRKVILFLGSNMGNMSAEEAKGFTRELRSKMRIGDLALVGLDLRKNPCVILAAYNDKEGITRRFNLNLLKRINREMNGNFDLRKFYHYPIYDPATGDCKSYLVSTENQIVSLDREYGQEHIHFSEGETIFMEVSHKFTHEEAFKLGEKNGFKTINNYLDLRGWFLDTVWQAI